MEKLGVFLLLDFCGILLGCGLYQGAAFILEQWLKNAAFIRARPLFECGPYWSHYGNQKLTKDIFSFNKVNDWALEREMHMGALHVI